jgi:replicative DNA helicase
VPMPELEERVERLPPHNLDAEAAVLGSCLLDPSALDQALDLLRKDDFYRGSNQKIYEAVADLHARSQPVDLVTVQDWLASRGLLEATGGPVGLASLTERVASATNVEAYARLVKEKAKLRRLIATCAQISQECYTNSENASTVVDTAENLVLDIGREEGTQQVQKVEAMMMSVIETVESYRRRKGAITGIGTGFTELDNLTAGMHPGQLIVAAGRPGSGKTAFALNIAQHVAIELNKPVVIYSLEMTNQELLFRLLCSKGSVDSSRLRRGTLEQNEMGRLINAATHLQKAPLYINDNARLDIQSLRSSVQRMVKEKGVELVLVDYLQLLTVEGFKDDRVREVTMISGALKAIAKEMKIPVLVASQLNRGVEQRQGAKTDSKPRLSDLRESGSIEQDADVVMLIHRKSQYSPDAVTETGEKDNTTDIIIAKQRSGPTGDIRLAFVGQYTRFENMAGGAPPQ